MANVPVQQYLRESDQAVLSSLDVNGNLTVLGNMTPNSINNSATVGQTTKVTITAAQLLALRATPQAIIPAPGAGKFIQVLGIALRYIFKTTAYTIVNANLKLMYGDKANALALCASQSALLASLTSKTSTNIALTANSDTEANLYNQPINLENDGSAEFLAGDGLLEVLATYNIVTP